MEFEDNAIKRKGGRSSILSKAFALIFVDINNVVENGSWASFKLLELIGGDLSKDEG